MEDAFPDIWIQEDSNYEDVLICLGPALLQAREDLLSSWTINRSVCVDAEEVPEGEKDVVEAGVGGLGDVCCNCKGLKNSLNPVVVGEFVNLVDVVMTYFARLIQNCSSATIPRITSATAFALSSLPAHSNRVSW